MKKNSLKMVPIGPDGSHLGNSATIISAEEAESNRQAGSEYRIVATPMVPNVPFSGTMRLVNFVRGLSSATFTWYCVETDQNYVMFMVDMVDTIAAFGISKAPASGVGWVTKADKARGRWKDWPTCGVSAGRWMIVRRGQYYGLQPVTTEDS